MEYRLYWRQKKISQILKKEKKIFFDKPVLYDLALEDLTFLRKNYEKHVKKIQIRFEYHDFEYKLTIKKKINEHQAKYLHLRLYPAKISKNNLPDSARDISRHIKRNYVYKIHCNWTSGPTFSVSYSEKDEVTKFDIKTIIEKYRARIKLIKFENPPEDLFNFAADRIERKQ